MQILKIIPFRIVFLSLAGASALASSSPGFAAGGRHHSLLIFAPDMLSKTLSRQLAAISGRQAGLDERAIAVIYIVGRSASAPRTSDPPTPAVKLRAHYKVGLDEFRTILADQSGEIELISDVPVTAEQLFETTDAVPASREALRGPQ